MLEVNQYNQLQEMILGGHIKALCQQTSPKTNKSQHQQYQQPANSMPKQSFSQKIRARYSSVPNMLTLMNNSKAKPLMTNNMQTSKPVPLFSLDARKPSPPTPLFSLSSRETSPLALFNNFAKPTVQVTSPKNVQSKSPNNFDIKRTSPQKRAAQSKGNIHPDDLFSNNDLYTSFAVPPVPKRPAVNATSKPAFVKPLLMKTNFSPPKNALVNVNPNPTNAAAAPKPMPMKPRQSMPVGAVFRFAPYTPHRSDNTNMMSNEMIKIN